MKKNRGNYFLVVGLALGLIILISGLINSLTGPRVIHLEKGWQKIQINGIVPKGAIVIVDIDSKATLPSDDARYTGYINQGRVNFHESMWMMTETSVWVYYPDDYEFLQKKDNFSEQCSQKMSDLGGLTKTIPEYDVGHP